MRLIIENVMNEDLKPFINEAIIPAATQIMYSIVDFDYLATFNTYLQNRYKTNITARRVLTLALNNLIIYNYQDTYEIAVNPNTFIKGINAKLYDLCALINYGNMEIHPYPIFDKIMEKLGSFVSELYDEYMNGD